MPFELSKVKIPNDLVETPFANDPKFSAGKFLRQVFRHQGDRFLLDGHAGFYCLSNISIMVRISAIMT
ncbi:MAG TPA: hypothetical protein PLP29_04050 [Candidatus Ozemobacteraceae bacterium]|nr:hypothetical protein [Candidatus Ozemobacteraceae bacterium]